MLQFMGSQIVGHDWMTELSQPFPPSNHKSFYICDYFCSVTKLICATFLDSTCKQYLSFSD